MSIVEVDGAKAIMQLRQLHSNLTDRVSSHLSRFTREGSEALAEEYRKKAQKIVDRETGKFFQSVITGGNHRGIGRTTSLSNPMGAYNSPALSGRGWKSLSDKTLKRENGPHFFRNKGKLEKALSKLNWSEVFGAPTVRMRLGKSAQQVVAPGAKTLNRVSSKGKKFTQYHYRGRFQSLTQVLVEVEKFNGTFTLDIDYSELEGISRSFDFEKAVADHSSDEKTLVKLKGKAEWYRPLIGPYVGWMIEHNIPRLINKALK